MNCRIDNCKNIILAKGLCNKHYKRLKRNGHFELKNRVRKTDRLYTIWRGMKERCLYEKAINFSRYGGKGIKICDSWLIFNNFYDDMAEDYFNNNGDILRLTLDRIDNTKGYSKENCRWATYKEQIQNRQIAWQI